MKITDNQINDYLDNRLDEAKMENFEKALRRDPSARQRLEEARLLRFALRAAAPKVPSERMLKGIHRRLHAVDPVAFPKPSLWERLGLNQRGFLRWGVSVAAVAVVLVALYEKENLQGPSDRVAVKAIQEEEKAASPAQAKKAGGGTVGADSVSAAVAKAPSNQKRARRKAAPAAAEEKAVVAASTRPLTEVERALKGGDLDRVIAALLDAQTKKGRRSAGMARVSTPLGKNVRARLVNHPAEFSTGAIGAGMPVGRVDQHGFWNWTGAAMAMNRRDWPTALAEFDAARREAPAAGERSFAASARLSIHNMQGEEDVLNLGDLRRFPGLRLVVLASKGWRIWVPQRKAWFKGEVKSRLPGFRSRGEGFTYDLAFDRGVFSPGTRFTRMAGELASPAYRADGSDLNENSFAAPRGADFNFSTGELRLK